MNLPMLKKVAAFYARFTLSFTQVGYRFRSLTWPKVNLDFKGQHWLVTGGSGGLGKQIALSAAKAGATVTIAARSASKLAEVISEAKTMGITGIDSMICDFSLQSDTSRFLKELVGSGRKVDVLVNNVGVLNDDHTLTAEGREASFAINFLSHYLLTEGMIKGHAFGAKDPLVINMTSGGGYNVPLSAAMMNNLDPTKYNGSGAYGFHKRAQMVINQYWRDKYRGLGLNFYVMHPGWADTDGVKRSLPRFRKILKTILRDAESGSDTAIWLAAVRPPQEEKESVWFDRAQRAAHAYERTRATKDTPQSLVDYMDKELARFPESMY